jgi:hypothetical protein
VSIDYRLTPPAKTTFGAQDDTRESTGAFPSFHTGKLGAKKGDADADVDVTVCRVQGLCWCDSGVRHQLYGPAGRCSHILLSTVRYLVCEMQRENTHLRGT